MWVEFTADTDIFPKGSVRDMDDVSAESVIKRGVAKKAKAPEGDSNPDVPVGAWGTHHRIVQPEEPEVEAVEDAAGK